MTYYAIIYKATNLKASPMDCIYPTKEEAQAMIEKIHPKDPDVAMWVTPVTFSTGEELILQEEQPNPLTKYTSCTSY